MDGEFIKGFIGLGGLALITGLVQLVKKFINDTRYYPVVAVIFGIIINMGFTWALDLINKVDIVASIMQGIVVGLASSGLYSTIQTLREGESANKNNPTHTS